MGGPRATSSQSCTSPAGWVASWQVYNEQIYDLVAGGRLPLAVREDSQRGVVQVRGWVARQPGAGAQSKPVGMGGGELMALGSLMVRNHGG